MYRYKFYLFRHIIELKIFRCIHWLLVWSIGNVCEDASQQDQTEMDGLGRDCNQSPPGILRNGFQGLPHSHDDFPAKVAWREIRYMQLRLLG